VGYLTLPFTTTLSANGINRPRSLNDRSLNDTLILHGLELWLAAWRHEPIFKNGQGYLTLPFATTVAANGINRRCSHHDRSFNDALIVGAQVKNVEAICERK
jgi:hypothetical protein